jgi:hypothetical protein
MRTRNAVLWLLLSVQAGCVCLPRLTLAASSSFRSREAPYRRSALLSTTATLGWSLGADSSPLREPVESADQDLPWNESAAGCGPQALCDWESQVREQALARVGLSTEGNVP